MYKNIYINYLKKLINNSNSYYFFIIITPGTLSC